MSGDARSASSAASVRPLTSFMVKYGRPSANRPSSYTGTMPGMLELAADLGLLDEPLLGHRPPSEFSLEHLEREVSTEVWVAALEDHAHPTAGDLPEHLVTVAAPRHRGGVRVDDRGMVGRVVAQQRRLRPPAGRRIGPERGGQRGIQVRFERSGVLVGGDRAKRVGEVRVGVHGKSPGSGIPRFSEPHRFAEEKNEKCSE